MIASYYMDAYNLPYELPDDTSLWCGRMASNPRPALTNTYAHAERAASDDQLPAIIDIIAEPK